MKKSDVDKRWEMIGALVHRAGSREEKIAWALCRGDASEWRLRGIFNPKIKCKKDKTIKKVGFIPDFQDCQNC